MPNLILTSRCNNACAYCFTDGSAFGDLTLNALKEITPFVSSFDSKRLNILGGEPSLNPEFIPVLQYLLDGGYELLVFTNGNVAPLILKQLQGLGSAQLEFVVNRSDEFLRPNTIRFFKSLGHRTKIGLTIFKARQEVRYVLRDIEEFRLRKSIRIGIALPSYLPSRNVYPTPEDYPEISGGIFPFLVECIAQGIKPEFDCGFPYCFFTDEQNAFLHDHGVDFASNCGLIPDILPDQTVIPCFPLAKFKTPIDGGFSWANTRDALDKSIIGVKRKNLYEACSSCRYLKSEQCSMGCAAFAVNGATH